ncbi:MAG: flavodoxin domain-containing protein [Promethearchaeota archaeon]
MSKVLILYGTRYGTTKGIVDEIEKVFQENNIDTKVYNLKEHSLKDIPPLTDFNGVLIGTGIKIKMWTKDVKKYVQKKKAELKQIQNKLGFFICCGTATKKEEIGSAIEQFITPKLEKLNLKPALIDAFGGAYDLREESLMGSMSKKIMMAALKEEKGMETVESKLYDYRDWDHVREYTNKFISIIK